MYFSPSAGSGRREGEPETGPHPAERARPVTDFAPAGDQAPGYAAPAEPRSSRDLPEAGTGVLDDQLGQAQVIADLDRHRATRACGPGGVAQQVGNDAAH